MPLSLKIALSSLAVHRLRTLLAMIGVFLGALALTGVQHLSQAMILQARQEVERLGPNLMMAVAGQIRMRRGEARVRDTASTFTIADALAIMESVPQVVEGSAGVLSPGSVTAESVKINCQIVATWSNYARVRSLNIEYGRFLLPADEEQRELVCVLGNKIAQRLFGSAEAAQGRQALICKALLRAVGVMAPMGADITGTDQDEQVFVPLSTYMRRLSNQNFITGVYLQLQPGADAGRVKATIEALLRERHNIQSGELDDFSVMAAQETIELQEEALGLVRTLGLISASISFAVGGLGILSIMVLLVRSRRLEIGIRRALGATRADIVRQFLLESGLMSTTGGALGAVAAIGLMIGVSRAGFFPMVLDPETLGLAMLGSAFLGLGAGAYPAWQASRLEILDVLKAGQ